MKSAADRSQSLLYEFGPFVLDEGERLLFRGPEVIPLRPKVFDLLLALVEHSGHMLSKEELLDMVWPDAVVEEGSLTRNISTLRKALGESSGEHPFIETIPWRGYRFVGTVRKSARARGGLILEEYSAARIVITEEDESDARVNTELLPTEQAFRQGSSARAGVWWRSRTTVVIFCLVTAALLLALLFRRAVETPRRTGSKATEVANSGPQLLRFTATGNILFGCISPDGKFAAYVSSGAEAIWIKQVASGSTLCVVPAVPKIAYWGLTFSPDSNFLYYVVEDRARPSLTPGVLYRLPAVGGTAEKLLTHIATHPSFSPDGRQMIFKRSSQGKHELVIADANGRNQRVWATGSWPYDFWAYSWSPNGQTIAYANSREDETGRYWYIAEMPVQGGTEKVISKRRFKAIRGMDWLPDGRDLVVVAEDPATGLSQLWKLSGDGTERRLTNDVNDYWRVSVTADGNALLTSQQERPGNIFVASMTDARRPRQITAGIAVYDTLTWTPDDRLVYTGFDNGMTDIWMMSADGSGQKRLTANAGTNKFPAVSPDGRYIHFVSNRAGRFGVWRMQADGSDASEIGGEATGRVQCSPDSRHVFYTSDAVGSWALWRVPPEKGEPERVRDLYSYRASISPDGKLLAYTYLDEQSGRVRLAISPLDSDTPIRTFDADIGYEVIRWVDGGEGLAYISGRHEIRVQPVAGGKPRVLLTVSDELFSFDISRDGKQMAYISGRLTTDLILIRGF